MDVMSVLKATFHRHEWHEFTAAGWRRRRRCTKCGAVQIFAIVPVGGGYSKEWQPEEDVKRIFGE